MKAARAIRSSSLCACCCVFAFVIFPFALKQPPEDTSPSSSPNPIQSPRLDAWHIIGPGGGGALFHAAINPLNPQMMLLSCDMGGSYISKDGGATWRMFNLWTAQNSFAFDPKNANVILAYGQGMVWRSDNAGDSWRLISPQPSAIAGLNFPDEEGGIQVLTQGWQDFIRAVAFDPDNSTTLYGVNGSDALLSQDGGKSWRSLGKIKAVFKIVVDPESPIKQRTVYFIARDRVFTYRDGKMVANPPVLPKTWITDAAGGFAAGKSAIYVITGQSFNPGDAKVIGGLMVSYDGGASWAQANGALFSDLANKWVVAEARAIAVDLHKPDLIYLSFSNLARKSDPANPNFGVAESTDGGKTWSFPWMSNNTRDPANLHDIWLSQHFGPDWGENPLTLDLDPANNKILLTGDLGRCMKSTDAGASWYGCYSTLLSDGTFTTNGIDVNVAYNVYFDPFDAHRIFMANTDIGLLRSENGGGSWTNANEGVPTRWRNATYALAFDPAVKGKIWAAMSNRHDLPLPRVLHFDPATYKGGILVSSDGGKSWSIQGALPEAAYTDIEIDLSSPSAISNRVLYTAAIGHGIYKSTDSGATWALKNDGLPPNPLVWQIRLDANGTLYTVIARRRDNGKYDTSDDGAVYRSIDAGEHWHRVDLPEGLNGPTDIEVDPSDPNRLYLSAWSRTDPVHATHAQGGVFVSRDAGQSWTRTLLSNYSFSVTIDHASKAIYAATSEAAAWRSADGGTSWTRIRGFNFRNAHRIIPDPHNPKMIYIATNGGGVWYGPAEGDPNAAEDIATPEISFGRISKARQQRH